VNEKEEARDREKLWLCPTGFVATCTLRTVAIGQATQLRMSRNVDQPLASLCLCLCLSLFASLFISLCPCLSLCLSLCIFLFVSLCPTSSLWPTRRLGYAHKRILFRKSNTAYKRSLKLINVGYIFCCF